MYGPDSRALYLDAEAGNKQKIQKGYREQLLCEECEQLLQRDETYFANSWFEHDALQGAIKDKHVKITGIEFTPFLRFHLSVLWRASISKDYQFSAVSLGPYQENLRRFLNNEVDTPPKGLAVYGLILRDPESHELCDWVINAPHWSRPNGVHTYTFIFGGCSWQYSVSSHKQAFPDSLMLKSSGEIIMPVLDYTEEAAIKRFLAKWNRE